MAPTQTVVAPTPPPERSWPPPPLHLRVLDLAHPGAVRFFSALPNPAETLSASCTSVLTSLYPTALAPSSLADSDSDSDSDASTPSLLRQPQPPKVRSITLHLRAFDGVAHTNGSELDDAHKEIHVSTTYLANLAGDGVSIRREILGVLVHELVHVWQWDGRGSCDGGLIEGIADWVRLGAGLGAPHWTEGGRPGDDWDAGYATTAYFLVWLSRTLELPLLVPQLNLALRSHDYKDGKLFENMLGKDPVALWKRYQKELAEKEGDDATAQAPAPTHPPSGGYNVAYTLTV